MSVPGTNDPANKRRRASKHGALIEHAVENASGNELLQVLDGTVADARAYCNATLLQFSRRASPFVEGFVAGKHFTDTHLLLIVAHEAVCHAARVEQLLHAVGEAQQLPPTDMIRERLRVARNLLAEHRDEQVL